MMFAVLLMKLFDWDISDNDPRQNNHLSQIGYSTLKNPHIVQGFFILRLNFKLFNFDICGGRGFRINKGDKLISGFIGRNQAIFYCGDVLIIFFID